MRYETTRRYGINWRKTTQLITAGAVASAGMMMFTYGLRALDVAAVPDFAAQYGAVLRLQDHPQPFSNFWWAGMAWHAINGAIIFALLYDYLAHQMALPNRRWSKGAIYGTVIWMLNAAIVAPLAGEGMFFRFASYPWQMNLISLTSWLVYGLVLDGMTRVRVVHHLSLSHSPI